MDNQPIIIDGCNVAECLYIEGERCLNYILGYGCKDNSNCYFKQLQRLKAENEKLKKENKELKQLKDMYFTFYKAKHDDINGTFFKFKQALEDIEEIAYTTDFDIVDIQEIVDEVLK